MFLPTHAWQEWSARIGRVTHHARDGVGWAAGGEGHDDADGLDGYLSSLSHPRRPARMPSQCRREWPAIGAACPWRFSQIYEHDSTSSNLDQQATCSLLDGGLD